MSFKNHLREIIRGKLGVCRSRYQRLSEICVLCSPESVVAIGVWELNRAVTFFKNNNLREHHGLDLFEPVTNPEQTKEAIGRASSSRGRRI